MRRSEPSTVFKHVGQDLAEETVDVMGFQGTGRFRPTARPWSLSTASAAASDFDNRGYLLDARTSGDTLVDEVHSIIMSGFGGCSICCHIASVAAFTALHVEYDLSPLGRQITSHE